MKYHQLITALFLTAIALNSCSSNEPEIPDSQSKEINIIAEYPSAKTSRVNDTGFDKDDCIGVYVVNSSETLQPGGNMVNNAQYTYSGNDWTPLRKYYWDEGTYNVYAYYPYNIEVDNIDNFQFKIPSSQDTKKGLSSADFLWANVNEIQASANPVRLSFSHALSKVIVVIKKSDDYQGELPKDFEVYIHGTHEYASIDLSNGGATANTQSAIGSIKAYKLANDRYTAIVAPQRISSRRPLVEVISSNVSYMLEGTISFRQGVCHTITVTLSKNPQQVEIEIGGGINDWD